MKQRKVEGQRVTVFQVIDSINALKTPLMFKLEDCFLLQLLEQSLEKWKQREKYLKKRYRIFMSLYSLSMKLL
jgi:hypothetical protein